MAKFVLELPDSLIKDFQYIYDNSDRIFGAMTQAGAEVVEKNMKANAPSKIERFVKVSRTYRTPSDDGINTKVYVSGYMPFSGNRTSFTRKGGNGENYTTTEGVPADFVAQIYEYGRSNLPFPKKPFMRKAFKKKEIEEAMLKAQIRESGGLLDE
jgi:hypothetical protein